MRAFNNRSRFFGEAASPTAKLESCSFSASADVAAPGYGARFMGGMGQRLSASAAVRAEMARLDINLSKPTVTLAVGG